MVGITINQVDGFKYLSTHLDRDGALILAVGPSGNEIAHEYFE